MNWGVNFSLALTPSNGTGTVPFTVAYTIVIHGGFAPWQISGAIVRGEHPNGTSWYWGEINGTSWSFDPTQRGNITITEAGVFEFYFYIGDGVCDQSGIYGTVTAVGPAGPAPVSLTASNMSGPAPLAETFALTVRQPPAQYSIAWWSNSRYPNAAVATNDSSVNVTFLQNGTWGFYGCAFRTLDWSVYGCSPWTNVTVTGRSAFGLQLSQYAGGTPLPLTGWFNVTNPAGLPTSNYSLTVDGEAGASLSETGPGVPLGLEINESQFCHWDLLGWLRGGNTTCRGWAMDFSFWGGPHNDTAEGQVDANITPDALTGGPLTFNITISPLGGPRPQIVDLNLSVTGGSGPYPYDYLLVGRTNNTPNGTFLPNVGVTMGNVSAGSISIAFPLNVSAEYWITGSMWGVEGGTQIWCPFNSPLFSIGPNVTVGPMWADGICRTNGNISGSGGGSGGGGSGNGGGGGGGGSGSGSGSGSGAGGGSGSGSGTGSGNSSGHLALHGSEGNSTGTGFFGVMGTFSIVVSGGVAPYTVAWTFGDGTTSQSTSTNGTFRVQHDYDALGVYRPSVSLFDRSGSAMSEEFPPIAVVASDLSGPSSISTPQGPSTSGAPGPYPLLSVAVVTAVVAMALIAVAMRWYRRELVADGEAYVADVPTSPDEDAGGPDAFH
ncbi:MAG: PKD domain-containing protein [Thermoplasmata archaeon]|nr:PKD domain-containing protein [Thermoplasmata archaeon]